ncbi:MAG: NAD(P)-dependent oxidoreductase [Saprospiraceae bacterium]
MKKVLITDDCHPLLIEELGLLGFECVYVPKISYEETLDQIPEYSGLIINSKILVNKDFIDRAEKLEFVGRLGSGMEIVDRDYAAKRGVAVFSSPEGNCNAVAEQALGMLLALATKLLKGDPEVRENDWRREENRGFEIMGRTIGIVGFGHTGSQFAKKLSGMGMRVLAHDKYKSGFAESHPWVEEVSKETIMQEAEIISLHLPLNPETKHYVDAGFIADCRHPFILINTSRGNCVDTPALISGLESGKITGACLDVFENEKTATYTEEELRMYYALHQYKNTVFMPHVAGWTHESKERLARVLIEKISAHLS